MVATDALPLVEKKLKGASGVPVDTLIAKNTT